MLTPSVVTQEPTQEAPPVIAAAVIEALFTDAERNPSDWNISVDDESEEEDAVIATHNSGRVFNGSLFSFSAHLRG